MYDDNRRRWNSNATRACANSRYQALTLLLNRPGYEARLLDKQRPVLVGLRMEYGDPACGGNPLHKGADTRGEREGGRHEEEEKGGPGSECECEKYRRRADNRGGRGLRAPSRAPRTHANMNKACSENRSVPDADEPRGAGG